MKVCLKILGLFLKGEIKMHDVKIIKSDNIDYFSADVKRYLNRGYKAREYRTEVIANNLYYICFLER